MHLTAEKPLSNHKSSAAKSTSTSFDQIKETDYINPNLTYCIPNFQVITSQSSTFSKPHLFRNYN